MRALLLILFFFSFITITAQTKLTLVLNRDSNFPGIDSIKITRFSTDEKLIIPYSDSVSIYFPEKYADLCSAEYQGQRTTKHKWQFWIDTGDVKIKARLQPIDHFKTLLVIDTFINSPITYAAKRFYDQLGDYRHRTDTVALNTLLLNAYKENKSNPLSFIAGRVYYDYNRDAVSRYPAMIVLEKDQSVETNKSIFYSMMARERFRNTEKLFINYFNNTVLINAAGQETRNPLDKARYNVIFVAGPANSESIAAFNVLSSQWEGFAQKDYNFFVIYSKDKETWNPIFEKSKLPYFQLINEKHFTDQAIVTADTKFYIVDGVVRMAGVYDNFEGVVNHFK